MPFPVALGTYLCIGGILPLFLSGPLYGGLRSVCTFFAQITAIMVLMAGAGSWLYRWLHRSESDRPAPPRRQSSRSHEMPEHRAHAHGESLLLTTTDLDRLRALHWEDFEHLIAAAYRRMGYAVRKAGGAKPDGGVDIVLEAHGMRTYVQCKQWQSWKVGVNIVRELYGVMAKDHIDRGIVITCGEFTKEAKDYCRDLPIELVDGNGVIALLRDLDVTQFQAPPVPPVVVPQSPVVSESNDTPACPNCGALMVTRTATRGAHAGSQFWGCPHYPRCRGTRQYPSTT